MCETRPLRSHNLSKHFQILEASDIVQMDEGRLNLTFLGVWDFSYGLFWENYGYSLEQVAIEGTRNILT
jgi:hypothetical protein